MKSIRQPIRLSPKILQQIDQFACKMGINQATAHLRITELALQKLMEMENETTYGIKQQLEDFEQFLNDLQKEIEFLRREMRVYMSMALQYEIVEFILIKKKRLLIEKCLLPTKYKYDNYRKTVRETETAKDYLAEEGISGDDLLAMLRPFNAILNRLEEHATEIATIQAKIRKLKH